MKCLTLCSLALTVTAIFTSTRAQDPWEKYQPRRLDQIVKQYAAKVVDDPDIEVKFPDESIAVLTRDSFPSRVTVTYTGQSRPISPKRKELINHWLRIWYGYDTQVRDKYVKLWDMEFLFTENLIEYWLPVQTPLIQHLQSELKKGDDVTLFVAWVGARKEADKIDWVFFVNEFEKE